MLFAIPGRQRDSHTHTNGDVRGGRHVYSMFTACSKRRSPFRLVTVTGYTSNEVATSSLHLPSSLSLSPPPFPPSPSRRSADKLSTCHLHASSHISHHPSCLPHNNLSRPSLLPVPLAPLRRRTYHRHAVPLHVLLGPRELAPDVPRRRLELSSSPTPAEEVAHVALGRSSGGAAGGTGGRWRRVAAGGRGAFELHRGEHVAVARGGCLAVRVLWVTCGNVGIGMRERRGSGKVLCWGAGSQVDKAVEKAVGRRRRMWLRPYGVLRETTTCVVNMCVLFAQLTSGRSTGTSPSRAPPSSGCAFRG